MKFIDYIKSFFKDEEDLKFPSHFFLIRLSPVAKSFGINDSFNKEIDEIKSGVVINTSPYSDRMVESIKRNGFQIIEENYEEDEEYEYDTFAELGVIKFKK